MKQLFLQISSFSDWSQSDTASIVWNIFHQNAMTAGRIGKNDPPRTVCTSENEFKEFWTSSSPSQKGEWLFFSSPQKLKCTFTAHWFKKNEISNNGYNNILYTTFPENRISDVLIIWEHLCDALIANHGFIEREDIYNYRAHKILSDGRIEKTLGGYRLFIPGFFAFNFFGNAYKKIFNNSKLLSAKKIAKGIFLYSNSEFLAKRERFYTVEENRIIDCLGREFFRIPDEPLSKKSAPSVLEQLRATHV